MHTVKAIILKSIPHSEQQQILHVYSEERGYMQMITPLALFKRKANTSAQCMQIVEIEFIPNERGGLHKLKSFSPLVNTSAIYFDVYKMNIALLPHSAKAIHALCTCQLQELKDIPLNQQGRKILLDIALLFLGFHLNLDFNTKSIRVIREIFS